MMDSREEKVNEETIDIRYGLMDILAGNLNAVSETNENKKHLTKFQMYKTKIRFPIIETILMENGQFLCWLFTDSNGYVMKKNLRKLGKDYIILYFIHQIKSYFKTNNSPLEVTDEKFINDLNQFSSFVDQNIPKSHLFKDANVRYLIKIERMKFIHVYLSEGSRIDFLNILEFFKIINDSHKMNSIILIQNFISLDSFNKTSLENELMLSKEKVRYLIVKFRRKDEIGMKRINLYYNKPKLLEQIDCDFKGTTLKNIKKRDMERRGSIILESKEESGDVFKSDNENDLIMVNNENLITTIEKIIDPFIRLIEKKRHISITLASLTFIKVRNELGDFYAFQHGERLTGISKYNQEKYNQVLLNKNTMNNINSKYKPRNMQSAKPYEKITKDAFCFGEFCDYTIPQYFKNIKKNNKIDDLNKKLIPLCNKFTSRDRNYKLPYSLPVFHIKKAYDNPHLVNVVLKAYSIFPKNFDKDAEMAKIIKERKEEEEKRKQKLKERDKEKEDERKKRQYQNASTCPNVEAPGINTSFDSEINEFNDIEFNKKKTAITLYTPVPNKFINMNYDEMYDSQYVCDNCFKIYTLIYNFLSNIDETTSQFKSLSKAKDILLQGENLNLNMNLFEEANQIGNEENLLFQEEIQEFSLKKMIKKNILREKLDELNRNKKKDKVKLSRNHSNKKKEFNKAFTYKIDINPRLLKLNLVAEKSKNKFFKLIFNELRQEPESLYQKLCIQKPDHEGLSSMKSLRMHMGINSNIYNPELAAIKMSALQSDLEEEYLSTLKQTLENKEIHLNNQRENNQIDNDIFLIYKNNIKKDTNIEKERGSLSIQDEGDISQNSERDSDEDEEIREEKSLAEEDKSINEDSQLYSIKEKDTKNLNNSNAINNENRLKKEYITEKLPNRVNIRSRSVVVQQELLTFLSTSKQHSRKNLRIKTYSEPNHYNNTESHSSKNLPLMIKNLSTKYSNKKLEEREKKRRETYRIEKEKKLKQFLHIERNKKMMEKNIKEIAETKSKLYSKPKNEKKITLFTVINDRTNTYKLDVPYYYISTPLPKFNEGNIPVTENPLILTQNIKYNEYIQLGKFKQSLLLSSCDVFVYDTYTAIPYKVVDLKLNRKPATTKGHIEKSTINKLSEEKTQKLFIIVLNDFFDSYDKYQDEICDICRIHADSVKELKCVFFNLPGQSSTMWSKKCVFNNMYYSTFLDRFLFHLSMNQCFDQSYSIIFFGFGNGGNIALTYTSFYEKYWDFIHSVVMVNSFCENDTFLNQSMVEILKIINNSKNPKLVDFFIKSVTVNPQTLISLNIEKGLELNREDQNPITLAGYHNITKGYFFNLKINHKDIKTRIVAAHSNQNCFISINNLNTLFANTKISYSITKGIEIPYQKYILTLNSTNAKDNWGQIDDLIFDTEANKTTKLTSTGKVANTQPNVVHLKHENQKEQVYLEYNFDEMLSKNCKRKIIVMEGSHDIQYNDSPCISNILSSYLKFIINNSQFQVNR